MPASVCVQVSRVIPAGLVKTFVPLSWQTRREARNRLNYPTER